MTFIESLCFAKVYTAALGLAPANSITRQEKDIVAEALKRMADQSPYWTKAQKESYKLLVEFYKRGVVNRGTKC